MAFSSFENLFGSDGSDTFAFVNSGAISGLIDGGLGANELDYSAYTAGAVSVNLNNSTATAIGGTFANIAVFSGSASADSLTASDGDNTILVNGADSGTLDGLYSFTSFENLLTGNGDDTIAFSGDGSLSGSLDGGSDTDTLDFSNYNSGVTVNLNSGTADVLGGTLSGIENLIGSDFADDLTGGSGANRIEGRAGDDSLSGLGGDDIYIFRDGSGVDVVYEDIDGGTDSLVFESSARGVEFTFYTDRVEVIGGTDKVTHFGGNVEVFLGTDLDDRFVLQAGAALTNAKLDGGLGSDSLDYSAYGSIRQVVLTDLGSLDGFQGTEAAAGSFDNINEIIGSAVSGDSLTGRNADAVWHIDTDTQYESSNLLDFSGFELLAGGSGHDTFDLSSLSGDTSTVLTGKGAVDGFSGASSAFAGSFTNMDEVLAGIGTADSLTGIDADATWHLGSAYQYESTHTLDFSGFELLVGGSADDIFALESAGSFAGTVNGGAGDDRISYTAYGSSAQIDLGAGTATALGGYISIEGALGSVYSDTLIGTAGNDTFNVTADGSGVWSTASSASAPLKRWTARWARMWLSHAGYATAVVLDLENKHRQRRGCFQRF